MCVFAQIHYALKEDKICVEILSFTFDNNMNYNIYLSHRIIDSFPRISEVKILRLKPVLLALRKAVYNTMR